MAHQAALAQAGALQLVVHLLAHALHLGLQHLRRLALAQPFGHALQHRQRGFQAVREVAERVAVAFALAPLAVEQAVQRVGQAQQLAGMLATQVVTVAAFHFVQLAAQATQGAEAPGQAQPEQAEQYQQRAAQPQAQLAAEAVEHGLVFAGRLHGDDAVGGGFTAQQVDLQVVDEELLAARIALAHEVVAFAVVARAVVYLLVGRGGRAPQLAAFAVVDEAEQA